MGDTNTRLPALDPLIADSVRNGTRVRLVLRQSEGDAHPARIVEGIVLAIVAGRDGRSRIRMGIPTGSGDPVEVRVLLDSIDRVERVESTATPSGGVQRSKTGAHRRPTLAFGSGSDIQARRTGASGDANTRGDSWDDLPGQADKSLPPKP